MKNKLTSLLVFLCMLPSCSSRVPPVPADTAIVPDPNISVTVTKVRISTPTHIPTITPIPTLSQELAYQSLINIIQEDPLSCSLPCLWGIRPGISTNPDAQRILSPLASISDIMFFSRPDRGEISFRYPVNEDGIFLSISYHLTQPDQVISTLDFEARAYYGNEDSAQEQTILQSSIFEILQEQYGLSTILSEFGIPTEVYVTYEPSGGGEAWAPNYFYLRILYPKQNTFASYEFTFEEQGDYYYGCPSNSNISLNILSDNNSDTYQEILPAINPEWDFLKYPEENTKNIFEVTQMTIEEFYQTFLENSGFCLTTPKVVWTLP